MGDQMRLTEGARPWTGPEGVLRAVYRRYNIPLAGVLQQDGHYYLFRCIFGHDDDVNVWIYAMLYGDELGALG